jgi:hypothetical protein
MSLYHNDQELIQIGRHPDISGLIFYQLAAIQSYQDRHFANLHGRYITDKDPYLTEKILHRHRYWH